MKTEEQKSAFILRVEEMVKEIETLMQEGGGNERSCILLVNEKPQDSDMTTQCIAIMGSGKRLIESMSVFIERPNMAEVVSLGAKLAALKKTRRKLTFKINFTMNQAIAKQDRPVDLLKATINAPSVQEQFKNALGEHKDTFVASLIDLYTGDRSLQTCKPSVVIAEALRAATLRLPLNKALGFAYIVVYNNSVKQADGSWVKVPTPTFIPGYKGYIQLAMRTGQYRTINADVVYEGEVRKVNKLTGEIAFDGEKTSDKIIGYFCYFELLNGFSKTLYVTVEDMAAYAKRYSPSVKKETTVAQLIAKANDGIIGKKVGWEGNFNDMALKTVIRRLLSKYGYLSVEMQNAMAHDVEDEAMSNRNDTLDNAAAQTVDLSATEYEEVDTETGEVKETGSEQAAPAPAPEY